MDWPPPNSPGWRVLRREGLRFCFGDREHRAAGGFVMLLGFGLLVGVWLTAFLEPPAEEEWRFGTAVFCSFVFVPIGVLGLWLVVRRSAEGILDVGQQQVERLHWLTGRVVETRSTKDLYLVVWSPRLGESSHVPDGLFVSASIHPDAEDTELMLWCGSSEDPAAAEACLDALQEIAPWKGESGEEVRFRDRVSPGPVYPLRPIPTN